MRPAHFIRQLEDEKIVAAIREAEHGTSGQIRVHISHRKISDALAQAQNRFEKLGMTKTRERNAVLIYVAPRARKFAVVGDIAVHAKCGEEFWKKVSAEMTRDLQNASPTNAIVNAVKKIGALLAEHFPPQPNEQNELPDKVERD